jgi:hypothetical protein
MLERLDWRFIRVRSSHFFRDPDATTDRVCNRLGQLGVQPIGPLRDVPSTGDGGEDLRDRVVRRAAELRREWEKEPEHDEARTEKTQPGIKSPSAKSRSDTQQPLFAEVEDPDGWKPKAAAGSNGQIAVPPTPVTPSDTAGESDGKLDKQPWQMTRGEFHELRVTRGFKNPTENSRLYWQEIKKALAEGKRLQPRVLHEYVQLFGPLKQQV